MIHTALLSVSDKTDLLPLAHFLHNRNIRLLSTGGTAKVLQESGIPVTEVSAYTGFPELMEGRLKTLHPKIHGGLLGRLDRDAEAMVAHQIAPIDLLVVNLYPFVQTVADPHVTLSTALEHIDIGGPALLRAAAKNYDRVTVLSDPQDYARFMAQLDKTSATTLDMRLVFAQKAFAHTADYDRHIANYLAEQTATAGGSFFPAVYQPAYRKKQDLSYGENPHQKAALYQQGETLTGCVVHAQQLQGKPLSYNNLVDSEAALECLKQLENTTSASDRAICVIIKHANPCGAAMDASQSIAYKRAFIADATSAYGGVMAFNKILEAQTAAKIIAQQFVEVIVVPDISEAALRCLAEKPNLRLLKTGYWVKPVKQKRLHCKTITAGLLLQEQDDDDLDISTLVSQTPRMPTPREQSDLAFAWKLVKSVKSNAIVFVKNGATLGIGAGQMSRIDSTEIALRKATVAGFSLEGAVMASDAFFPFPDNVEIAAKAGVTAIIQPGGSIRDNDSIAAATAANMTLLFTGIRHFWH